MHNGELLPAAGDWLLAVSGLLPEEGDCVGRSSIAMTIPLIIIS
jgi:hypothetical protein